MRTPLRVYPVILALAIAVADCGGSPTAPSNTVDFQGVWQGSWQKTSCSGTACDVVGSSGGLRITLTQTGTEVQGTVEWAQFFIPASGSVDGGGTLSLTGQAHLLGGTETISNWSTRRSGAAMNGGFTIIVLPDDASFGPQTVQLTLQNVIKTS